MSDYLTMAELENSTLKDIYAYAKEFKIPYYSQMNKKELSLAVIRAQAEKQGFFFMAFCGQLIMDQVQKTFIFLLLKFVVSD